MSSILLIVEKPDPRNACKADAYRTYTTRLAELKQGGTNVQILSETVLLFPLIPSLQHIVDILGTQIDYTYAVLDQVLQFHSVKALPGQ